MTYASSSSSLSLSSSSRKCVFKHDVFLSFRGEDTRNGFTSHLHNMFTHHGIQAFMDDASLEAGNKIEELFDHINNKDMFVVILSENFGNSTWCLREISKIIQTGRMIIPVFFYVDPSEVKKQVGAFGKSFWEKMEDLKFVDKPVVDEWRKALITLGGTKGYVLKNKIDGNEAGLVEKITKVVSRKVRPLLDVAKHPISIASRVKHVLELLPDNGEVSILAITGMGGIGKTTLANALYNEIMREFDVCCFLENVRETAATSAGLMSLQKQLIGSIARQMQDQPLNGLHEGVNKIKGVLIGKKVLVVLDDVDQSFQLDALAGNKNWFGTKGSCIIITTRNNIIVKKHYQDIECPTYETHGLNMEESLELFSMHAFLAKEPLPKFKQISQELADTAGGLPLALVVYGSKLFVESQVKLWVSFLMKLKDKLPNDVIGRLRLSYDDLEDIEKQVFLDIATLSSREDLEYPEYFWSACGLHPHVSLKTLVQRSLIRIERRYRRKKNSWVNYFWMHDLIKDMASHIMKSKDNTMSPRITSKLDLELVDDIKNEKGIERIWVLSHIRPILNFSRLPNLRWLECHNCRLEEFPWDDLNQLVHLAILDLSFSRSIKRFKSSSNRRNKGFLELRVLDLKHCLDLEELPDLSMCKQLEKIDLTGCRKLKRIEENNIVHLDSLVHLKMRGCTSITELPKEIWQLKALENLDTRDCFALESLPLLPESLTMLCAANCKSLTKIPDLSNLVNLEALDLHCCKKLTSFPGFDALKALRGSNLKYKLHNFEHDLYISFRGYDTRTGIGSHLYRMLTHRGIEVFLDSQDLSKEERLDKLFEDMDNCYMFMVIFSENYGNSTWCLREVSFIAQSQKPILPVFYNVKPPDVLEQKGSFGDEFNKMMNAPRAEPENIEKWRKALKEVAQQPGIVLDVNPDM